MPAVSCTVCGHQLPEWADCCPECGGPGHQPTRPSRAETRPLTCPQCKAANPPNAHNCHRCGEAFNCPPCGEPLPAVPETTLLGRYRLEKHLKTGGFGAIYLARDTEKQNRPVVIKELILPDPREFKIRLNFFKRESEILQLLNEKRLPTVPQFYCFWQDLQKKSAYLVMEFIPGRNLEEIMVSNGNRPFDFPRVLEWAKTLCDVLIVMQEHEPPFINRDIKPENIMLLNDGRSIKMIDFGTAREMREHHKTRLGSEDYMAPEQWLGQPEPRSDLFSLAATLYHLATGKTPKGVETASELADLLKNPPPHVPRWFWQLLEANLVVPVDQRHPSAHAFKEDLERQCVRSHSELYPSSPVAPPVIPEAKPRQAPVATPPRENSSMADNNPAPSPPEDLRPAPAPPPPDSGAEEMVWDHIRSPAGSRGFIAAVIMVLIIAGVAFGIYKGWFNALLAFARTTRTTDPGRSEGQSTTSPSRTDKSTKSGGSELPPPPDRPFKSRRNVLAVIRSQLEKKPEEGRFQRFFTLENLSNNKDISKAALDQHRDALIQLLHQLGPEGVAAPDELGDGVVFRVDIRRLGWEKSEAWHKILAAYPYGLLDPDIEEIMRLAGNELPYVRADWFIAVASQEPLFYKLVSPGKTPQPSEAITQVRNRYQGDLKLPEAALELGFRGPDELGRKIQQDTHLRELLIKRHLDPLRQGGPVSREKWSAKGGLMTPFQEIAVSLGLGTANVVQE